MQIKYSRDELRNLIRISLLAIALMFGSIACVSQQISEKEGLPINVVIEQEISATSSTGLESKDKDQSESSTNNDAPIPSRQVESEPSRCTLSGGEIVEQGWAGNDTGYNSCNRCFCGDTGVLGCTKMACEPIVGTKDKITPAISSQEPDQPNMTEPEWGRAITGIPPIYAASDIDRSTIDLATKWYKVATDAWGNYGPTEIYIIGSNIEAARKVEDDFCDRHKKLDSGWKTEWDCANANYELFTRYAKEGSAGVSTYNRDYLDYYFTTVTLSTQRPSPDEEDYKVVTMHEYFHVYQHAHISDTEKNGDKSGRESKMGGTDKPWFAEGTAEFFAQLLYSRQPGVRANYLEEIMTRKYTSSVNGYLAYDKGLKDLSYADPIGCSWGYECWFATYDVGTWFIAYLVDQVGEETVIVDYYKDLDSLGFEGAFLKHFKKSSDEMVKDFDMFLTGGLNEALKILP